MVIGFMEGSLLTAPDFEDRLMRKLQPIVRKEPRIEFLFGYQNRLSLLAEWVVRKLQVAYPEKEILSIGVFNKKDTSSYAFRGRFTSKLLLPEGEDVLHWIVGKADFIFTFMDPLFCLSRDCSLLYSRCAKEGRCINLCTQEDMDKVREKIPFLPKWERRALAGKLRGESKTDVACELGVSKTTLRWYEIHAAHHIEEKLYPKRPAGRKCAVFGFPNAESLVKKSLLWAALDYLQRVCDVTTFMVSSHMMRSSPVFAASISRFCSQRAEFVELVEFPCRDVAPEECEGKSPASRILAERRGLIDAADIVLCDLQWENRTGLLYAKRKKIPVINLNEVQKMKGNTYAGEQTESIQADRK